jgi:hypothetical protein
MKNLGFLEHFIRIYLPGSRAGQKKLWLRLQQKVAAPPAPAPAPTPQHPELELVNHNSGPDSYDSRNFWRFSPFVHVIDGFIYPPVYHLAKSLQNLSQLMFSKCS